jgi:hypothetical protein
MEERPRFEVPGEQVGSPSELEVLIRLVDRDREPM